MDAKLHLIFWLECLVAFGTGAVVLGFSIWCFIDADDVNMTIGFLGCVVAGHWGMIAYNIMVSWGKPRMTMFLGRPIAMEYVQAKSSVSRHSVDVASDIKTSTSNP